MAKRRGFLRRMVNKLATSFGIAAPPPSARRVRFSEDAAVYEFERQLLGGGGVPDGDAVALGLGPRYGPRTHRAHCARIL